MSWLNPKNNSKAQPTDQSDDSFDLPYDGLAVETEKETLSLKELKRLRFVRWGLRRHKGHFDEFLIDGE